MDGERNPEDLGIEATIREILKSSDQSLLDGLPKQTVDVDRIMREMRRKTSKGGRFSLRDEISEKGYTVDTYRLGKAREYVTVVTGTKMGKSCMRPLESEDVACRHTHSMREAIQLHYDAVGFFKSFRNFKYDYR